MLLPVCLLLGTAFATAQVGPSDEYLLPQVAQPLEYTLFIDPRLENFSFTGYAVIQVVALQSVSFVEFHAAPSLSVSRISLNDTVPLQIVRNDELERVRIVLGERLVAGERYTLRMGFGGALRDDLQGLYRSSYVTASGETRWLVATQLESTSARLAFPCWDEPRYKAKFSLHVQRASTYTVTSNMPLESSLPAMDGRFWDTFETSPPMSSYLVAIIVSDFAHLKDPESNYSVWVQKEDLNQLEYAVDVGPRTLAAIENLTKIPYMLPKLDLAAIPDFNAGAMENWGMVTFRASDIQYLEGESPESAKRVIAGVITHEQGHLWFGDWVSPAWWRYTWLNEAFATYLETLALAATEPTWRLDELFPSLCNQYAMPSDALPTAHPLSYYPYSPAQIEAGFDATTYEGGASKLRMIDWYMGNDNFWKGLNLYLNAMSLSVATQEELFTALAKYAPAEPPLAEVFRTWTEQAGYPLVTVQRLFNGSVILGQERHFYLKPDPMNGCNGKEKAETWWIPLTWTTQSKADFNATGAHAWLSPEQDNLLIHDIPPGEWAIFNLQSAGYYRVQYDNQEWQRLAAFLAGPHRVKIHPVNRGQLLDDAMSLAQSNYLDYTVALPMTQFLQFEDDPVPWESAYPSFNFLNRQLLDSDALPLLYKYMQELMNPMFTRLASVKQRDDEDSSTKVAREEITSWACRVGIRQCIQQAQADFAKMQATDTAPPPDLRRAVYCSAVKTSNANYSEAWNLLWKRYQRTRLATEKSILATALACTEDVAILRRYIAETISSSTLGSSPPIRPQDASLVFDDIAISGPVGAQVALEFMKENMTIAAEVYGNTGLGRTLRILGKVLNTENDINQFKEVLRVNEKVVIAAGHEGTAESAIKVAEGNVQWRKKNLQTVRQWLHKVTDNDLCIRPYLK